MAEVLDCNIKESIFELQSSYHVHFQTNTLEKGMDSIIILLWDESYKSYLLLKPSL